MSSMTSPNWTSRIVFSGRPICGSIPDWCRDIYGFSGRQDPSSWFESNVLADAQLAIIRFKKVADFDWLFRRAQLLPGGIFVGGFDLPGFFVVSPLDVGGARNVGRLAEM